MKQWTNLIKKSAKDVISLKTLIKSNKLTDIWRDLNENVQQFKCRRKDQSQAIRIDMIFTGMDFCMPVESCKINLDLYNQQTIRVFFLNWDLG